MLQIVLLLEAVTKSETLAKVSLPLQEIQTLEVLYK